MKRTENAKCLKDMEQPEPSSTVGGNLKWFKHFEELFGSSKWWLQLNMPVTRDSAIYFLSEW